MRAHIFIALHTLLLPGLCVADAVAGSDEKPPKRVTDSPPFTLMIRVTLPQRPEFESVQTTRLSGRWAVVFDGNDEGVFACDLEKQQWYHWGVRKWVTLEQCAAWAEATKQRSQNSPAAQNAEEAHKKFIAATLEPNFKVEKTDKGIRLSNDAITYDLTTEPMPKDRAEPFLRYQRLIAYSEAMMTRKIPPFPLLALWDELRSRKLFPKDLALTIRPPGAGEQKINMAMELHPPNEDQEERVKQVIDSNGTSNSRKGS